MPKVIRHIESPVEAVRAVPIRPMERRRRSVTHVCQRTVQGEFGESTVTAARNAGGEVFVPGPARPWPLPLVHSAALVECLCELGLITADDLEAHRLAHAEVVHRMRASRIASALADWAERAGRRLPKGWRKHLSLED